MFSMELFKSLSIMLVASTLGACGLPKNLPSLPNLMKIVGGAEATPNSYPWTAMLIMDLFHPENFFCGGALITDEWLLTAAHCFTNK